MVVIPTWKDTAEARDYYYYHNNGNGVLHNY